MNPVRVFDEITRVDAEAMVRNVFVFRKFTIPDDWHWSWKFMSGMADGISVSKSKTVVWSEHVKWMN